LSTATGEKDAARLVRVTHPFHPLHGREFEVVDVRSAWGEWRVYVTDEDGRLVRLPASWTNWAEPDLFQVVSGGRSPLHIGDLRRLAELLAGLWEEEESCQANDARTGKQNSPKSGEMKGADEAIYANKPRKSRRSSMKVG
jgi:hypothetical protein